MKHIHWLAVVALVWLVVLALYATAAHASPACNFERAEAATFFYQNDWASWRGGRDTPVLLSDADRRWLAQFDAFTLAHDGTRWDFPRDAVWTQTVTLYADGDVIGYLWIVEHGDDWYVWGATSLAYNSAYHLRDLCAVERVDAP